MGIDCFFFVDVSWSEEQDKKISTLNSIRALDLAFNKYKTYLLQDIFPKR